jgi:murein DD-endopeptidase MepM/ murein hydrolase activator NlpD
MMAEKVKVKPGDTMSALAKKAGVSLADFIAANPQITNPNLIRPGQVLNIPVAQPTASTTDSTASRRPDAEYDERVAAAAGTSVVDQSNSTTSNVDNDGTNAGSDSDVQEEVDTGFDIEKYTKEYLDKVTEAEKDVERKSAFNILKMEFEPLGLGSLVDSISNLLTDGTPPAEFPLRLRSTQEYKDRFKANEVRLSKGLSALSPADYVGLEDKYQAIMRNYDLPESYYTKDETGRQVGFEQLIGSDVSSTELENRIITAKDRVVNANPEVSKALKQFYPDITDGDILAYALDPKNALKTIQSKVTAAEIGGTAMQFGLGTSLARAEELQKYGVDKASATEGFQAVAEIAPRGGQLAAIYGESPYTQQTAEQEIFGLTGSREARRQRQKVTGLEKATFGGQSGVTSGALARDRAGGI